MELKGKKVLFLGDSITEGVGVDCVEETYWKQFEALTGTNCIGYGISGTRIAFQPDEIGAVEPYFDGPLPHYVTRVDSMDDDADIVVVFGGTNDFGHGFAPIGDFDDRTDESYYGALHNLCVKLLEKYPAASVVFMAPMARCTETDKNPLLNDIGMPRKAPFSDYVDIMKEVCGYYSIPVLDLYRTLGINPIIEKQKQMFVPDGLHPNKAGAKRIALRLKAFLESL